MLSSLCVAEEGVVLCVGFDMIQTSSQRGKHAKQKLATTQGEGIWVYLVTLSLLARLRVKLLWDAGA